MSRLICKFQVVGPVQTNCYFLYREDTKGLCDRGSGR